MSGIFLLLFHQRATLAVAAIVVPKQIAAHANRETHTTHTRTYMH